MWVGVGLYLVSVNGHFGLSRKRVKIITILGQKINISKLEPPQLLLRSVNFDLHLAVFAAYNSSLPTVCTFHSLPFFVYFDFLCNSCILFNNEVFGT